MNVTILLISLKTEGKRKLVRGKRKTVSRASNEINTTSSIIRSCVEVLRNQIQWFYKNTVTQRCIIPVCSHSFNAYVCGGMTCLGEGEGYSRLSEAEEIILSIAGGKGGNRTMRPMSL